MSIAAKKRAIQLSRLQEEELVKCVVEPVYFMKKYLEIQHPTKGRLPFTLYDYQERVVNNLITNRFNIILKSRQLGLSTVTSAYCLWLALFHRDKNILLVADNFRGSKNMLEKIKVAWEALPKWMLQRLELTALKAESSTVLMFANGSKIEAFPTTENTARGQAASFVVVDEAAVNEKLEEAWKSIYSTVQTGGSLVVFSTPKGKSGQFYKLWSDATKKDNDFVQMELPWHVHPEHDQSWFDKESRNMDERQIAQEMLCSFESSGNTFFNVNTIEWLNNTVQPPLAYNGPSTKAATDMWIWKTPIVGHKYVIGADVARGDADDFSTFHIMDTNENEVVAEYMGKIPLDRYGEFLVKIGTQYNNALVVQEKNSVGIATAIKLRDLAYPNLYYPDLSPEDMLYLTEEELHEKLPGFTMKQGNVPGNREEILSNLEEILRNHKIKIYSSRFADQTTHFNWNGKRGQAAKGRNDDLVMALAILCYVAKPDGSFDQGNGTASDWQKAFLAGIGRSSSKVLNTGIGSLDPGGNIGRFQLGTPTQTQYYNGVRLKPGVKPEHVAQQQALRHAYGWVD